jgi:hypothetical protein
MDEQMTVMSLAQQRKEIHGLFSRKASAKDKAEEAYNLSLRYGIHEPWMSLCAYKLAHALLSSAADETSLLKAESLFQDAMGAHFLGPWPGLFRLAALEHQNPGQNEPIKKAFMEARDALLQYRHHIHSEHAGMDLDPRPGFEKMIGLASAFLGRSLSTMPENPLGDDQEARGWILVGHDPKLPLISLPRDFVLQEMEALSKREKDAIFFKLSSKHLRADDAPFSRHWRKGGSAWQAAPHYPALRLLAMILSKKTMTMQGLLRRLCGGDSPAERNTFSKNKERLAKELARVTQRQAGDIFVSDRGDFPEINPAIQIYGAVEKSAL